MIKPFNISAIKNLQNKDSQLYEVPCLKCGEKNSVSEKDKMKFSPKHFYKSCKSCLAPIEGEWKKLIKE